MGFNYPNQIEALTPADAVEVEHNNTSLVDYMNANVITRDGQVAMTAPLKLVNADPSTDNEAARKSYVDALLPIGTMMMYGAAIAPAGRWKLCDGSSLQIAAFPKLYAVLGTRYGGTGGTFNLPNLKHRVPIGVDVADTRFATVGKVGGTYEAQLVSHVHDINHNHGSFASGAQSASHTHAVTLANDGAHTHNIEYTSHADPGSGGLWFARRIADVGTPAQGTSTAVTHSHDATVGSASASHTHMVDVPNFVGTSGAKGTAGIDQIPEFCVIAYIIRTD